MRYSQLALLLTCLVKSVLSRNYTSSTWMWLMLSPDSIVWMLLLTYLISRSWRSRPTTSLSLRWNLCRQSSRMRAHVPSSVSGLYPRCEPHHRCHTDTRNNQLDLTLIYLCIIDCWRCVFMLIVSWNSPRQANMYSIPGCSLKGSLLAPTMCLVSFKTPKNVICWKFRHDPSRTNIWSKSFSLKWITPRHSSVFRLRRPL